jgi:hypothetical protein
MARSRIADAATARLRELAAGLRGIATLRRHERRTSTYALRLACLALLLVALPVAKLIQLGVLGLVLALLKVAVGVALVAGLLWLTFAAEEWAKRRRGRA